MKPGSARSPPALVALPAVVILEPDALGNLPSGCGLPTTVYPFTDAERIAELQYAVSCSRSTSPGASRVPRRDPQRVAIRRHDHTATARGWTSRTRRASS